MADSTLPSGAILVERNKLTFGTTWHSAAQVHTLRHSHHLTKMIQYPVDPYARPEEEAGRNVSWMQIGSLTIATMPDRAVHVRRQEAQAHVSDVQDGAGFTMDIAGVKVPGRMLVGPAIDPSDERMRP